MTTIDEITTAITELPRKEEAQIRAWLNERAETEWDLQIEEDERSGRLDALVERALSEHRTGRTQPI
jgi:hypothetical protein